MRKSVIALLTFATIATVSCKKDTVENQAVTKENIAGSYTLTSIKVQTNGGAEEDGMSGIEACEVDNVTTLKTDDTYTVVDAGTQCSPASDESGQWSLVGTTGFVFDGVTSTIKSWNGKQLVLTQTDSGGGITIVTTSTLNKQ